MHPSTTVCGSNNAPKKKQTADYHVTHRACPRFKPKIAGVTAINTRYRFPTIKATPVTQKKRTLRF